MKNVLITGGLGFIGSNLAIKYLTEGYNVSVYDNLDKNSGSNKYNLKGYKNDLKIIRGDILNFNLLKKNIKKNDLIINCAASTSHIQSMKNPLSNLDVNIKGVLNILEVIRQLKLKTKYVQIGTTTQIGKLLSIKADERHPEFPRDIYSANKMIAEKYVDIYSNSFGLDAFTIRLPNTYGPRACINNPELTFNNYFIGQSLQKKPILVYGRGEQIRNTLFINDGIEAIFKLSKLNLKKHEVFICSSDHHYKLSHVALRTAKIFEGSVKFIKWPKNAISKEIGDAKLSNNKLKKFINCHLNTPLDTGLEITKEFFLKNYKHHIK